MGYAWKRCRLSLATRRDETRFREGLTALSSFLATEERGEVEVYFLDESGFNTVAPVPYAWQPIGETLPLPSSKSQNLSVLGCINHELDGHFALVEGSVNSQVVIDFIDQFIAQRGDRKTPCLLLLDNAPMHRSRAFRGRLLEWQAQGVVVAYLPPYSPELNHIEILWRKIKYEWLPLKAWEGLAALKQSIQEILEGIGHEYQVNFV